MNHGKLLFLLFLAMLLLLVWAFAVDYEERLYNHGEKHPVHTEMNQGGDGRRYNGSATLLVGETWGVLQIVLFVALLSFGLRPGRQQRLTLTLGAILYIAIFLAMTYAYRNSISGRVDELPIWLKDPPRLFLGLPVATAWMIYGLGLFPLFFIFFYLLKFDRWVLTAEDHQAFQEVLKSARQEAKRSQAEMDSGEPT